MKNARLLGPVGALCLAALLTPGRAIAQTPSCAARYDQAFAQVSQHTPVNSQALAAAQVDGLVGPTPGVCEPGAYQHILSGFQSLAVAAIQGRGGAQQSQLYFVIALVARLPRHVPAEDGSTAVRAFRETRAALDDAAQAVPSRPLIQQLLSALGASSAPAADAPAPSAVGVSDPAQPAPATPAAAPTSTVLDYHVPTRPLPAWAVIKLTEARQHLVSGDAAGAQVRLEQVLQWIQTAP